MSKMLKTSFTFGVVALVTLLSSVASGCGGSSQDATESIDRPTPTLNDHNGIEAQSLITSEGNVTALGQWTDLPDFVAVATVTGQADLPPQGAPESQSNYWNTLRKASIERVLWTKTNSSDIPTSVDFIDEGWSRSGESGEVHPIVTKGSVRLDVGDTFVAAFVSKQTIDANLGAKAAAHNATTKESGSIPPSSGPATTFDVPDTRPDWQILGPAAKMLLTADGRIAVADDAPEFQQPLRGMTVDEFRQALLAAQSQN